MHKMHAGWFALMTVLLSACYPDDGSTGEGQPSAAAAAPAVDAAPSVADFDPADETALAYTARVEAQAATPNSAAIRAVPGCIACHGSDGGGIAALNTPTIGGLEPWYIARQLHYFKRGIRGLKKNDVFGRYMHAFALMLDDTAEIDALAGYFASLEPEPMPQLLPSGDVEHGRMLYQVCSACHGPNGDGNAQLNAPRLVGQSVAYLVRQLNNYRAGARGASDRDIFGRQMQPIVAATLKSPQDSVDVVAYIATLEPAADGAAKSGDGAEVPVSGEKTDGG